MAIIKYRDENGNVQELMTLRGEKGDKGDKGDAGANLCRVLRARDEDNPLVRWEEFPDMGQYSLIIAEVKVQFAGGSVYDKNYFVPLANAGLYEDISYDFKGTTIAYVEGMSGTSVYDGEMYVQMRFRNDGYVVALSITYDRNTYDIFPNGVECPVSVIAIYGLC